jgi:hypothetical protein
MAESATLLVDEVLPHEPIRQWVLSFPFQLRFQFASRPELMGKVLGIVYRAIASHLIKKVGLTQKTAQTGSVTLIQRFGRSGVPGALNLNPNAARWKPVRNVEIPSRSYPKHSLRSWGRLYPKHSLRSWGRLSPIPRTAVSKIKW